MPVILIDFKCLLVLFLIILCTSPFTCFSIITDTPVSAFAAPQNLPIIWFLRLSSTCASLFSLVHSRFRLFALVDFPILLASVNIKLSSFGSFP